jgi:hypothetical protein
MNKQKSNESINQKLGLPKVGYTPMDTVEMEGAMFRSMSDKRYKKSLLLRISIITFSALIFILPEIIIIYLAISTLLEKLASPIEKLAGLSWILFSLLFFSIGTKIIYSNIKK